MAVDKDGNEVADPETPVVVPPVVAPPSYVPADEFKTFQASITGTLDVIKESLQAIRKPDVVVDTPIEDVLDSDIETALAEGKGAATFRKMVKAAVAQLDKKYDSRAGNLESGSGNAIAALASRQAQTLMKHYDKPYVKQAVDQFIQQLPIKDRLNIESHLTVYNAVVGANIDKIIADEAESAARKANNADSLTPGNTSGRKTDAKKLDVETVMGAEAVRALQERGRSLDQVAAQFGCTADEYLKLAQGDGESNQQ